MTININDSVFIVVDLQEKLLPKIANQESIINNCLWLTKVANKLNIPTILCEQYPKGLGYTHDKIRQRMPESNIVEKMHFSAARNLMFIDKLASLNKSNVIICGIEAHVCVLQTALDLNHMDYHVYVAADSIGSRNNEDKNIAISRMQHSGISIVSKEMVLFEWLEKAGNDLFKEMSKEFLL